MARARKVFDALGLVHLVAHGEHTGGAIRLAGGTSGAVLRALGPHEKEAYGYVLGTGRLEKTGDLKKITNRASSGGAAMLDWPDAAVPRELVKALIRLHRKAGGDETFDAWLRHAREGEPAILYAHQDALALTAPEHAARLLGDWMSVQYDRAIGVDQELPAFGIPPGRQQLVDLRDRLRASWMPSQVPATAQWLREIGALTGALRAAEALRPMFGTHAGASAPQRYGGDDGVYTESANRAAIPDIEYIGGIGGIGAVDLAPRYPRARQVRAQASLTSNGEPVRRLGAGTANVLHVQLASASLLDVVADTPFSVEDLPSEGESLELDLTLLPLAGVVPEQRGIALRQRCRFSKQLGEAPVCDFALAPAPDAAEYRAPLPGAAICAKVGLDAYPAGTCGGCADRQRADLICPSRFWGLSKVIERRPFVRNAVSSGEDYAVSLPGPHRPRVPDLRDIVYGVSARFTRKEGTAIKTSLKKLAPRVHTTGGWGAWRHAVAAHGPQMLVAVGHLQPGHAAVDMLEIGDDLLRCTNVCAEHIRKHPDDIPIVLLLGCGTLYTEDQLGSFVRHFSRHGAGLVVATIASMFTAQAHACVDAIAQAFDRARGAGWEERQAGHHTAGFAVLRAKQALMTVGSGLALALTGAGDGEWEF